MAIKKILDGGKPQNDPIEAAKRKVFLIGTPVGVLTILAVWAIGLKQHNMTVANIFILPLLAMAFLILTVLYWRHIIHLRAFELVVYGLVLVYALAEFAFIILAITFMNGSFGPEFTLWLPFVYILSFLILSTNLALLLSGLFFLTTLILGWLPLYITWWVAWPSQISPYCYSSTLPAHFTLPSFTWFPG